jgi:glycosyltransferase involved in cell wall biosynthesis
MKVLLVAHTGYPWGGVSQIYTDLLETELLQKVDLAFFESSPNKRSFSSTGSINRQNIFGFLIVCINYIKVIFHEKPSIVHIASAYGFSFLKHSFLIIIAKLWGCKVILAPHCSISVFIPKSKVFFLWMKFVLNLCDGLIVLSGEWLRIKEIAPNPKIFLLKNAINLQKYLELIRSIKKQNEKVGIIYLGHIGSEKGIMDLIQAVKTINMRAIIGFELWIYGEDLHPGEIDDAKELAESLIIDSYIIFSEPVFGDKKLKVFQEADIYVLPSYHEGMPISIIEAMGAGLAIIATNVGGIPDLIEDGRTGLLVPPGDVDKLANALIKLITEPDLRLEMGLAGRSKAIMNNDIEKYAIDLFAVYKNVAFA